MVLAQDDFYSVRGAPIHEISPSRACSSPKVPLEATIRRAPWEVRNTKKQPAFEVVGALEIGVIGHLSFRVEGQNGLYLRYVPLNSLA